MTDDELAKLARSRIGQVLRGKYRLDRILGVGGMAVVYAATHRNTKRFAIKMLHPELSMSESIRTRFLREGYVANSVEHPGAVAVLDDDVAEDGSEFIVMELLVGATLDAVWERIGRVPVPVALSVGDALLEVLASAHAKRIVHRDIKPANLFLTADGQLRVLDFGIARLQEAGAGEATVTGAMLGTPAYMAPEQALAKSLDVDAQTDLWAVGATLFSLLAGKQVHGGENAAQVLVSAATQKAPSLASVAADVPPAVVALVDRALAFEKSERWGSAVQMRAALQRACVEATGAAVAPLPRMEAGAVTGLEPTVASGEDGPPAVLGATSTLGSVSATKGESSPAGGVATPEWRRTGASRPPRRARGAWMLAAAALAVLALGGGTTWLRRSRPNAALPAPAPSAGPEARPSNPAATPAAEAAYEEGVAAHADGKSFEAVRHLEETVAADPLFGPAYLRLAILTSMAPMSDETASRAYYQKALEHRATLGARDAALLEAWEPRFRTPPDRAARAERMEAVARRFPGDAYVELLLGISLRSQKRLDDADAAYARALAVDPRYAPAFAGKIDLATQRGDRARAAELIDQCVKAAPAAVACFWKRYQVASEDGRCEDAVADARRVMAIDPTTKDYYFGLAQGLAALGEPSEVVSEVLRRAATHISGADERHAWDLESGWVAAVLEGDLGAAERGLGEEADFARGRADFHTDDATIAQVRMLLEEGEYARARALLKALHARILALSTGDPSEFEREAVFAYMEVEAGAWTKDRLRAEQARLARTAREWQAKGVGHVDPAIIWKRLYIKVTDREEAADALAALPSFGPITDGTFEEPEMAFTVGTIYALGGRATDAAPLLRRVTRSCSPLSDLLNATHAWYLLGLALEQTGEDAGAREAYGKVLARWGAAKPRSVTADKARAGLARLAKKGP